MASEQAKELRRQGITAAKAGQKDQARQWLQQSLRLDPGSEAAWVWLATVANDQREKLFCLHKLLELNPSNEVGLQSLQQLGLTREQLAQQFAAQTPNPPGRAPAPSAPTATPPPPGRQSAIPQATGVPIPDQQRIAQAQSQAEAIVREYLAPPEGYPGIKWVQKSRRRAGERDIVYLRLYIAGAVAGVLIVLFVIGAVVVLNNPELRGIVFAPTHTLTPIPPSPTLTFTPTAGVTPTASPTPELTFTPSPTVPPEIPNGAEFAPQSTAIYPAALEKGVRDSIGLIDAGQYEVAIPTLAVEITRVASSFNPQPYYYQALALARNGELDTAAQVLQSAEQRLPEKPNDNFKPLIDSGLAYIELLQAEREIADGDRNAAQTLLSNVEDRAEAAIEGDPRLELPYLMLARRYRLDRDYDLALGVLDQGLAVPELQSSVNLIVEKGEIYLEQEEYELAAYQAFLALYINPAIEPAHLLQINTALAKNEPGLAVLHIQAYLFYYPGSVRGYKLLGDARLREGNVDLALEAFNQGLAAGEDNPLAAELLLARAAIYNQQRRYQEARDDLTMAFNLTDDPVIQAERMQAAYNAGNRATAERDAEALLGQNVIPDDEIRLLQARIIIDEAREGNAAPSQFEEALTLLNNLGGDLPTAQESVVDEYQAWAQYSLESYNEAFNAISRALAAGETGSRYYLRGLIEEAQGDTEAALRDYDWVLTLGAIYPYTFLPDARERAENLRDET